ncbi:MAG: hypothetical protein LH605_10965 [Microbacteriaceae bacterium]|nr:hypothetical protein [Microbacteriaceae bacterium]
MAIPPSLAVRVVVSFVALLSLAGCTSAPAAESEPEPTATVEPSQEPEPEKTAGPDDVLFTVSANVRAIDGTTLGISLTGRKPIASTDRAASTLVGAFVEQCVALEGRSVSDVSTPISDESLATFGSSLMRIDLASSPEGEAFVAPVDLVLGSPYYAKVASGDNVQAVDTTDTCTGRYQITGSGSGTAITNYESGVTLPNLGQWAYGHYGFTVPFESGATIEACRVVVSELAEPIVEDVPGWDPGSDATGISCGIGYRGE